MRIHLFIRHGLIRFLGYVCINYIREIRVIRA